MVPGLPGAPQDEAGLTRKFETSHVGGATCRTPPIPRSALEKDPSQCMKVKSESEVTQSCPTLSDPMDCSPPGPSIHGRVAFEEGSGPRVLLKGGPGNRGGSACRTTHVARLEFPRETGLILRCAGKADRKSVV